MKTRLSGIVWTALLAAFALSSAGQAEGLYTLEDLGARSTEPHTQALSISSNGNITGTSTNNSNEIRGFFISGSDPNSILNPLPSFGGAVTRGLSVNSSGQVAGDSRDQNGVDHAFLSAADGGSLTDLSSLAPQGSGSSQANGVNDSGMVVGSYVTSGGDTHFFLYNPTGNTFTDPFKNQSGIDYYGIAINNDGQIAGTQTTGSLSHGFYYDPSTGHFVDLNSLLGPSGNSSATSINGSGQVAGNSDYSGNIVHAFLTRPTEAP